MKNKKFILYIILLTLIVLTSCSSNVEHEEYSVSGVIRYDYGIAVSDVRLNFSNSSGSARTDSEGKWRKSGLSSSGTVTPAKEGYLFRPRSRDVSASRNDLNFTAYNVASSDIEITQVGRSYHDLDATNIGKVFIDSDETIWVHPSGGFMDKRDTIMKYSLDKGFIDHLTIDNLKALIYDNGTVFYTVHTAFGQCSVYELNSANDPRYMGDLRFEQYINGGRFTAKSSEFFYNVSLIQGDLIIEKQNFAGDYTKNSFNFDKNITNIYGVAANQSNLFVLVYFGSERYIYTFDSETLEHKDSFQVGSDLVGNPNSLLLIENNLFVSDWDDIVSLEVSNGEFEVLERLTIEHNFRSAFPYKGNYIISAWIDDVPGIYEYNSVNGSFNAIEKTSLEGDYLYDTSSIDINDQKLYIPCRKTIKIFENNIYHDSVFIDNRISNLAVNQNGTIGITTNDTSFLLVQGENVSKKSISTLGYGIDTYKEDYFIIRNRSGNRVLKYDLINDEEVSLFEFDRDEIGSPTVVVLPNDILALNWEEKVKLYDFSGGLLLETDDIFNYVCDMDYSDFYEELILLDSYSPGSDYLYFLNPSTLEIEKRISIDQIPGQKTGLAVDKNGLIYIATADNSVYELQLR